MEDNKKESGAIGGLIFVGCMFAGAGIGMLMGHLSAGGAIGMGLGFLAMAAYRANNRD